MLDHEKKSRSFQDAEATYGQIVNEVLSDCPGAVALLCREKEADTPIGKPLIQYRETDWMFIKRLAGMLGISLVSDYRTFVPRFSFGTFDSNTTAVETPQYGKQIVRNITGTEGSREDVTRGIIRAFAFRKEKISLWETRFLLGEVRLWYMSRKGNCGTEN